MPLALLTFSHMVMELANVCLIICLETFSIGAKYFGELTLLQSVIKQSYFALIYIGSWRHYTYI